MASDFVSQQHIARLRAKHIVFACIALMMAYVLSHNEHFLIDRSDPFWTHIQSFRWWLLPHGLAGAFVLAPLGAYIESFEERIGGSRSLTIATVLDAVLLISTTAIALFFIRNRRVQQHRQWMTRSYCVALVFFEVRLISGIFGFDDNDAAGDIIVWSCLVMAIPLADLVLQLQESARLRTQPAR